MSESLVRPSGAPTVEVRLHALDPEEERRSVIAGLRRPLPEIPSAYFYDETGSHLFEAITELPEYYPTRAERSILEARSSEIARRTGAAQLVELGSGAAVKTRLLLEALREVGTLRTYVPIDVSESFLRTSAEALIADFPGLDVHGIVGDFARDLAPLPPCERRRLVIFLGGTIGNLHPEHEAPGFLASVAAAMDPGDAFLLGVDLIKDVAVLEAAYDDAAGVTAAFNRNILRVVNRRFGFDFDPDRFDHLAFWDTRNRWIEMRLVARETLRVPLGAGEEPLVLDAGEAIRTEISTKYDDDRVRALLATTPFVPETRFVDDAGRFALYLCRRSGPAPEDGSGW